jgi:hypothetical protein
MLLLLILCRNSLIVVAQKMAKKNCVLRGKWPFKVLKCRLSIAVITSPDCGHCVSRLRALRLPIAGTLSPDCGHASLDCGHCVSRLEPARLPIAGSLVSRLWSLCLPIAVTASLDCGHSVSRLRSLRLSIAVTASLDCGQPASSQSHRWGSPVRSVLRPVGRAASDGRRRRRRRLRRWRLVSGSAVAGWPG